MTQRPDANPASKRQADELIQHLTGDPAAEPNCPLCGSAYEADGVCVIQRDESRLTLSLQCFCCGTGSLMTAPAQLAPEATAPLTLDDVLAWHRFLKKYRGDLVTLWPVLPTR